jgi:hypothetical protein
VLRYETEHIYAFTFAPLTLLGGRRRDFRPEFGWRDDRIEFRFLATDGSSLSCAECPKLKAGDYVLTGFSRRPTPVDYDRYLERVFQRSATMVSGEMVALSIGVT